MKNPHINSLQNLLYKLEENLPYKDREKLNISKASIGWHLDHTLQVFNTICDALKASKPSEYKQNFNITRLVIFMLGAFPRGKVEAPKKVISCTNNISKDNLIKQLEQAKSNLKAIESLNKKAFFKHPIFGILSKKQTMKFLEMHTTHHLKIINDIY